MNFWACNLNLFGKEGGQKGTSLILVLFCVRYVITIKHQQSFSQKIVSVKLVVSYDVIKDQSIVTSLITTDFTLIFLCEKECRAVSSLNGVSILAPTVHGLSSADFSSYSL